MPTSCSVPALADRLAVSEGDLRVILATFLDQVPDELDDEAIDTVCHQLDPHGERTVPALYGYPDDEDGPRRPVNPLDLSD